MAAQPINDGFQLTRYIVTTLCSELSLECAACWLNEDKLEYSLYIASVKITNDEQLRDHLELHAKAGHNMPEGLLDEILRDPDRYGNSPGYGKLEP